MLNPLSGAAPPDIAALIAQELSALAADAQSLASLLSPGDVVTATVLPSNGLTDLLDVSGLRVAAELPPSLVPGEHISVMVTGFDGDRINLQIVPAAADAAPPASRTRSSPRSTAAAAGQAVSSQPANGARPAAAQNGAPSPAAIREPTAPSAPGSAPANAGAALLQAGGSGAIPAGSSGAAASTASRLPPAADGARGMSAAATPPVLPRAGGGVQLEGGKPTAPERPPTPSSTFARPEAPAGGPVPRRTAMQPASGTLSASEAGAKTLEARLAAAHAASPPSGSGPAARPSGAPENARTAGLSPARPQLTAPGRTGDGPAFPPFSGSRAVPASPAAGSHSAPPSPPAGLRAPPAGTRTPPLPSPAARPPIVSRPLPDGRPPIAARPPAEPAAASPPPRGIAAFRQPAALLHGLGLPVTPGNLTAARAALEAPAKLPGTLAALDRALAAAATPDNATLRTVTGFLSRLDPRSPAFATQIAAFVDHIVTGREVKVSQLLQSAAAATSSSDGGEPAVPRRADSAASQRAGAVVPPAAAERFAVLRTGLDFDLKTQLLGAAARGAAAGAEPNAGALDRAVTGALTAITSVQLHAAAALGANPDGLAFSLPVALPDGTAQAHVRIDRDAPGAKPAPLDGDNFHIAFVLETRRLGTVAIEMMTVGRAVTLGVKTEAAVAARAFGAALATLTARLESLRYRIAKADAVVAPPAPVAATAGPANPPPPRRDSAQLVDFDA